MNESSTIAEIVHLRSPNSRLCFTDAAMSGGRTSRCVVLDAPCRRLRVVGDASSLEIFLNDGAAVLSTRYYPAGGQVTLRPANFTAAVYPLNL